MIYYRGMNDLYLTNGKTGHWRDLGLPKAKNIRASWPSLQKIQLNATRRETIPVAFRIDEVAYTMLCLFAEQCNLTTSAFVNEMINSYIEQNQQQVQGLVYESAINLSVERVASRVKKMQVEQVIINYHQDSLRDTIQSLLHETIKKKDTSFCRLEVIREILDSGNGEYLCSGFLDCFISVTLANKASVSSQEGPQESWNSTAFCKFALNIPYKKWVYIEPILMHYGAKCRQFLYEDEYSNLTQDKQLYEEIAKAINMYEGPEMVEEVAEKLKFKGNGPWSTKILQK